MGAIRPMQSRITCPRTHSRPCKLLRTASVPCKSRSMQVLCRKMLLLALPLFFSTMATTQTAAKTKPKPLTLTKYCHADGGFCIKYPASWSVLGEVFDGNGVVVAPPQKQEREYWDEVTAALVIPPPHGAGDAVTIDQAIEQAVSRVRDGGQSFQTLERQRRRVDGKPAQLVKLHYVDKSGGREWIEELVFVAGPDDEIYSVALKCAPSSMVRMEPAFTRIVDSWTLPEIEPPGDAPAAPASPDKSAPPQASTPPKL